MGLSETHRGLEPIEETMGDSDDARNGQRAPNNGKLSEHEV